MNQFNCFVFFNSFQLEIGLLMINPDFGLVVVVLVVVVVVRAPG